MSVDIIRLVESVGADNFDAAINYIEPVEFIDCEGEDE